MKRKPGTSETRRNLLKGLMALPFAGAFSISSLFARNSLRAGGYLSDEARASLNDLKGVLPKGKLGKYEVSRLVLGCNPMGGWAHSRDLSYVGQLSRKWHTETKMKETWALAEQAGINMCNIGEFQYKAISEFRKETGSKMLFNCQCLTGSPDDILAPIKNAIDNGIDFIYIQGENVDRLARNNQMDILVKAIDYIKSQDIPAGVGAHSLKSLEASVKAGIKPDFYFKTFHHDRYWSATPPEYRTDYTDYSAVPITDRNKWNDNMWDQFCDQTIEFFKTIDVPFFGFKVLAAGAIRPADGIRWAFENGADFICLGMYDFQIVVDVNTTINILANLGDRERAWY